MIFRKLLSATRRILTFVLSCIDAPFFLVKNGRIFANSLVYVFWNWSYGHTVVGLDYASRLYYPHRISLLFISDVRSNEYLPLCFGHNVDAFIYGGLFDVALNKIGLQVDPKLRRIRYRVLRFFVLLLSGLTDKFQVIDQWVVVYKTVSLAEDKLVMGDEMTGTVEVKYRDYTGYIRLVREKIGRPPQLPDELLAQCRTAIGNRYPGFFTRPFVTLLLREKGKGSPKVSDAIRCAGPHENYVPAVKYLTEHGYHVVGTGETDHKVFEAIPGYYSLRDVNLPATLLNLFLLMHCCLFIGQHSGPIYLPATLNIPILLTDVMPLWQGTPNRDDVILHKRFVSQLTGERISLYDLFTQHVDLVYCYGLAEKRHISIEPNTAEEILEAVKEMVERHRRTFRLTAEQALACEAFRRLLPRNTIIGITENCPPLFALDKSRSKVRGSRDGD